MRPLLAAALMMAILAAAAPSQAALSIEDAIGTFVFSYFKDDAYWCGFIEFRDDHSFVLVVHVDVDMDQIEDRYEVTRGSYEVRRNEAGEPGLYLIPEDGEPGFIEQADFSGMHLYSFKWQGRSYRRRLGSEPLFDMSGNVPERSGPIEVITDPAGASVVLDGERLAGSTPMTIDYVAAGVEHVIRIEQVNYQPYFVKFTLKKGEKKKIEVRLATGSATFALKTEPVVKVWMDDDFMGITPMWREGISAGPHRIELSNDALGIHEEFQINLAEGEIWKKVMRWQGKLELNCDVPCQVFSNDEPLGTTPLSIELPLGVHRLDLVPVGRRHGKRLFVTIELDKTTTVNAVYEQLD